MLVTPAPGRQVRDPNNPARLIEPAAVFTLPEDPAWQRLFHVFGDLVEVKPEPAPERAAKRKGDDRS